MKTKSILALAFLVIVAVFVVAGGASQAVPEKPTPGKGVAGEGKAPIKIGFIGRLSAPWGLSNKTALEISVDDLNGEGGILGRPVQLIVEDSKGEIPLVVAAYKKLVMTDRCALVVVESTEPVFHVWKWGPNYISNTRISCSASSLLTMSRRIWFVPIMINISSFLDPLRRGASISIRT